MRTEITSIEIAELFGKEHRDLLKAIKILTDNDYLTAVLYTKDTYTSKQNKKLPMYRMGVEGFSLMSDTRSLSRGASAIAKAYIMNEFGFQFSVVASTRSTNEDLFHNMLVGIFPGYTVVREYPIAGCRVDFYIKESELLIEYDEKYHSIKKQADLDKVREDKIRKYVMDEFDDTITIIRVKQGKEFEGIAAIIGSLYLSSNSMTREQGLDKGIENYENSISAS